MRSVVAAFALAACHPASAPSTPVEQAGPTTPTGPTTVIELPTGTPDPDEIRLNPTLLYQTVDGVGANAYNHVVDGDDGWDWDAVRFVYDELDIAYVRLVSWHIWWETLNDNDDPYDINWDGFQTTYTIIDDHDVVHAQYLVERDIEVMAGLWNVMPWLAPGDLPEIAPADYPELGELLASYILHMRNNGIPMDTIEVQNEPSYNHIHYDEPEDLVAASKVVLEMFDHFGLTDVQLHGPNNFTAEVTPSWARAWFADEELTARTRALSFHTWWSLEEQPYLDIREIAEAADRPVWATEVGHCADGDNGCGANVMEPWTWGTAWDWALAYYRTYSWAHASRVYHWSLTGYDSAVSRSGERYPAFYSLKHFANYISPESRMMDVASGDADVLVLGFLRSDGDLTVILLNTGSTEVQMRLTTVLDQDLSVSTAATSVDGAYDRELQYANSGGLSVILPPQSINSAILTSR